MKGIKSDRTINTSLHLIAGGFNAKIGKRKDESCMGSFSKSKRNTSGQMLIDFCGVHSLFVTNSSFKQTVKVFNQIGYIICLAA